MENNNFKISNTTKEILFIYLLGAIVVLAFAMRFPYLNLSYLGDDEGFTVFHASRPLIPWKDFLWGAKRNAFPPLDFILQHFVFLVFGVTNATTRYLPTFFDTLTVLLLGLLGWQCCNKKTGLIVALLWALSPCAIYFAKESRLYAHFAFAVVLYLLSISLYIKKMSYKRLLFVFFSLVYGFNVSYLFAFVMIPVPFSIFIYYIIDFIKDSKQTYKVFLFKFSSITVTHLLAALSVYGLFKFYRIISLPSTKVSGNPQLYSVQDLINKFLSRIEQAIYLPYDPFGTYHDNKGFILLIFPLVVFFLTLIYWRKNTFVKVLILCFLLFIPFYDIFTLYYGGKFSGLVEIRHSYFIVPVIYLGIAFSYNAIFLFIESFLSVIFINKTLNYILSFAVIVILITSFDVFAQSDFRKKSQMILKSQAEVLYDWINKKSSYGKTLVVVKNNKSEDLRIFSVIAVYDYIHASNIIYRIPTTIYSQKERKNHDNDTIHQTYSIDDEILKSICKNQTSLGLVYSYEQDFPYNELVFEKSFFDRMVLYSMKPLPDSMTYEQYLAYSNFFGNIFSSEWKGKIYKSVPRLISKNPDFNKGTEGWDYWKLGNANGHLYISISNENDVSYVKVQGAKGKQRGLIQSIYIKKGGIYRLSGKVRSQENIKSLFGAQIVLGSFKSQKEKWLTFLYKSDEWQYKDLIFTNDCSESNYLILRTGYIHDFDGYALFTDVKVEELLFEDVEINNKSQHQAEDNNHE